MYHFSRGIYRELAPDILEDPPWQCGEGNHERVLHACEAAVRRLATDWHYFARPSKTLFSDIRIYFPMSQQRRVYLIVDHYMSFAKEYFASQPLAGFDVEGNRLECRATTRRGTPCQRVAAAAQRLLPLAPAPGGDRGGPPRGGGGRGSPARRGVASWPRGRRLHRAGHHGLAPGGEPAPRRLRADGLQPHARTRRGVGGRARRPRRRHAARAGRAQRRRHHDGRRRTAGRGAAARRGRRARAAPGRARCSSTCRRSPPPTRAALGATLRERGHRFVDAPVTGSAPKAEDGTLTIMVGGARRGRGARDAAVRGDGRADRPRRRARATARR